MKKFNIGAFCAKKTFPCRKEFLGINYKDGKMFASDTHVLASVKADYPSEYEGGTYIKEARISDETIPADSVLRGARENTLRIEFPIEALKAACKLCRTRKYSYDVEYVRMDTEEGPLFYKYSLLEKIITACEFFGISEMLVRKGHITYANYLTDGKGDEFLIMPALVAGEAYIDTSGKIHNLDAEILDADIREFESYVKKRICDDYRKYSAAVKELKHLKAIRSHLHQ